MAWKKQTDSLNKTAILCLACFVILAPGQAEPLTDLGTPTQTCVASSSTYKKQLASLLDEAVYDRMVSSGLQNLLTTTHDRQSLRRRPARALPQPAAPSDALAWATR